MTQFVVDGAQEKAYDRVYHLTFSPGGKHFIYVAEKGTKRFLVVDGVEGKRYDSISDITISPDGERFAYVAGQRVSRSETSQSETRTDIGNVPHAVTSVPIAEDAGGPSRKRVVIDHHEQPIYDAIHSVRFSPDGTRLAYAAMQGKTWFVVVDGEEGLPCDDVIRGSLSFDSKGRLTYAAKLWERDRWIVSVEGQEPLAYTGISRRSVVSSDDGRQVAYVVQQGRKQHVLVNGREGPEHDGIMEGSIVFSQDGKHVAYAAKKGDKCSIVVDDREGIAHDGIARGSLVFSPDQERVLYGAQRGDKWLVVVGRDEGPEYDGIVQGSVVFSRDGKRVAYVAAKGEKQLVVVNEEEGTEYDVVSKDSLIFSPDSEHFAYAAWDGQDWKVILDGNEQGQYDYINFIIFSPDSQRLAYSALKGRTKVTLVEDEYEEISLPGISGFDKHKTPNEKGERRIRRSAGKWCVVVDGVQGREYEMVVNGTFTPDSKHFIYWAKTGEKWAVVLDDTQSNSRYQLLHAASKGTTYPHDGPVTSVPESTFFVHGIGLYCLSYSGSEFVFDTPTESRAFAKHNDILCRLEIGMFRDEED